MPIFTGSTSRCVLLSPRDMDRFYAGLENFEFSCMPASFVDVLFWAGLVAVLQSFKGI